MFSNVDSEVMHAFSWCSSDIENCVELSGQMK